MNRTTIVRSPDANVSRPISRKTRSGLTSRRLATTPISPATRLGIPASTIAMVVCSAIQRPADFLARVIHVLSKDETACGGVQCEELAGPRRREESARSPAGVRVAGDVRQSLRLNLPTASG